MTFVPAAGLDGRHVFTFPLSARRVFRRREKLTPSEWAQKYRYVSMSSREGRWRNENTPYLVGVMDAMEFPSVREEIVMAPPQTGKTECMLNLIAYAMDQDPAPLMYVGQTDKDARDMSKDRIKPMMEKSERLAQYIPASEDDMASTRIMLTHGMPVYLAWPSVSRVASKPIKRMLVDEEEKFGKPVREASFNDLLRKRTRTYLDHKIFRACSPTIESGSINQALKNEAEVVFHYYVRCQHCGSYQVMKFHKDDGGGVRWPEDERDSVRVQKEKLAWYECEHCQGKWDDILRDRAALSGEWRTEDGVEMWAYIKANRPRVIGFHYSALISSLVSLSETAAAFLAAKGDKIKLRDFLNGYLAEPWLEYQIERPVDEIKALKDERPMGVLPRVDLIAGVTAAADVQKWGCWYEIRAWGWGPIRESWQVKSGYVEYGGAGRTEQDIGVRFAPLMESVFDCELMDVKGETRLVERMVIDSSYDTANVYELGRLNRRKVVVYEGKQTMPQPHNWKQTDFYPASKGKNKPIPGGLRRLQGNANYWKDVLSNKLEVSALDPGAWHLCDETTDHWCEQLTVEYVDDKGNWQCPKGKDNHAWDCSYMGLVLADVMRIKGRQVEKVEPNVVPPKREIETDGRRRPGWFQNRGR